MKADEDMTPRGLPTSTLTKGLRHNLVKECFGQQRPYERPSLPHRAVFNGYHHSGSPGHLLKVVVG